MSTREHRKRRAEAARRAKTTRFVESQEGLERAGEESMAVVRLALRQLFEIQERADGDELRGQIRTVQAGALGGLARVYTQQMLLEQTPREHHDTIEQMVLRTAAKTERPIEEHLLDLCDDVLARQFSLDASPKGPLLPS